MARQRQRSGGGLHPVVIVLGACGIFLGPTAILLALDIPGPMFFLAMVGGAIGIGWITLIFGWLSWCFPPAEPQPPPPSRKGRRKRRAT